MNRRRFFGTILGVAGAALLPKPTPVKTVAERLQALAHRIHIEEALAEAWHGLPAADWINDSTYRSPYLGLRRDL